MFDSVYTYISDDGAPVINLGSLCRICQIEQETLHAFRVKTEDENIYLHEIYTYVTGLEISESDEFSLDICLSCCDRLSNAYFLKKQAIISYTSLSKRNTSHNKERDTDDTSKCLTNTLSETIVDFQCEDKTMNAVQFLTQHKFFNSDSFNDKSVFNPKDKKHECIQCGKKFVRKSNLVDHLRLHANIKLFKCAHCPKSFVQIGNFRTHMRIHTKERPFACHICSKSYNQSSALKIHIRSHTNERNYICDICSKAFTNSSDLNKHKIVHDTSKHVKCKFCNRFFAQKSNLRHHQKKVHTNQEK